MSREIRFRAWCRDGDWEDDGDKRKFSMVDAEALAFNNYDLLKNQLRDIKDEQYIMQYTGLKDKNGKEIYEGDILKGVRKEQEDKEGKNAWTVADAVVYRCGCFRVFGRYTDEASLNENGCIRDFMWRESWTSDRKNYYYQINDVEIIGNIYQNPELLK